MTAPELTRAQIVADLALHGWRPMSATKDQRPAKETLLANDAGEILRVIGERCIKNTRHPELMVTRVPRKWRQLRTKRLVLMHERLHRPPIVKTTGEKL